MKSVLIALVTLLALVSCSTSNTQRGGATVEMTLVSDDPGGTIVSCGAEACWRKIQATVRVTNNGNEPVYIVNNSFWGFGANGEGAFANDLFDGGCKESDYLSNGGSKTCTVQFNLGDGYPESELFPFDIRYRDRKTRQEAMVTIQAPY